MKPCAGTGRDLNAYILFGDDSKVKSVACKTGSKLNSSNGMIITVHVPFHRWSYAFIDGYNVEVKHTFRLVSKLACLQLILQRD